MKKDLNKKHWVIALGLLSIGLVATAYLATSTQLFAQEETTMSEEVAVTDKSTLTSTLDPVWEGEAVAEDFIDEVLTPEEEEEQARILAEITDPEVRTTTNVSTWGQFLTAINTQTVTVINVTANISGNTAPNTINRNLTINGNGNTINSQGITQPYRIGGNGLQFRINNATLDTNHPEANSEINFIVSYGTNLDVILTSVNVPRANNVVTIIASGSLRSVTFDGGINNITGTIVAAKVVRIINNARVTHSGSRTFVNVAANSPASLQNDTEFTVEEGSTVISTQAQDSWDSFVFANFITINGRIESPTFGQTRVATRAQTVFFGPRSESIIRSRIPGHSIFGVSAVDVEIAPGAVFDFIKTNGESLISNEKTAITTIEADTNHLALWDLGTQNSDFASLVFSDTKFILSGTTAQNINYTSSTEFRNLYSSQGLASYSRMRSTGQSQLTVQANPTTGGTPTTSRRLMDPGVTSEIKANPNEGYQFVLWETVSGGGTIVNPTAEETTFTMGNQTTVLRAVYEKNRSLTLQANPVEGGNPSSGSNSLIQGDTTDLSANPNPGYVFSRWEIVSGTGASISSLTSPITTFTMGNQDTIVRAVYEKNEPGEVHVHHVDTDGHELVEMETLTGVIGDSYTTEPKEIDGYTLMEIPANATGIFTTDLISVSYVYEADPTEATLTVEFVNENNQVLPVYTLTLNRMIGDQIDLDKEPEVLSQIDTVLNAGYEITERPESSVHIEEAQVTVRYHVQGMLFIVSAPETLDFGTLTYNAQTQRVESPNYEKDLIISDMRAIRNDGWTVTANLSTPMVNEDNKELTNALRYVRSGEEHILNQFDLPIYDAGLIEGNRTNISWLWRFPGQTDGLKLQIDGRDDVFTGRYTGVITWKVMAGQP